MALVAPLLLVIMLGSVELGHYFWNEHTLVKGVRDGARYAARQSFPNFSACTGNVPTAVSDNTKLLVSKGSLDATASDLLPNWPGVSSSCSGSPATGCFEVTITCSTTAGGQTMSGIYRGMASGAPIVTVTAQLPYRTVLGSFGFRSVNMYLNANAQAVVTGI
jgi:hypothetical protein